MAPISRQDVEREKSIRRLRELFYGKTILIKEARKLMERYSNDYTQVAGAIIIASNNGFDDAEEDMQAFRNDPLVQTIAKRVREQIRRHQGAPKGPTAEPDEEEASQGAPEGPAAEPDEEASQRSSNEESGDREEDGSVSAELASDEDEEAASRDGLDGEDAIEEEDDNDIQSICNRLRQLPPTVKNLHIDAQPRQSQLTTKNLHIHDQSFEIPTVDCLFSCEPCQWSWWRRVPERKQVSRCRKCHCSYDPVPGIHQWGYALFRCMNCNNSFRAYGKMGVGMLCYTCHTMVLPSEILPPRRIELRPQPVVRQFQEHSCYAEDCCNRREPYVADLHCVHPSTRRARGLPIQLYFSQRHERTESTVPTCVSQGDLMENEDDIIQQDLERIEEEEGEDDNEGLPPCS